MNRVILGLICLTYCILAGLYAVLVPPWETPDEPAHYRYVSELATHWHPAAKSNVVQTNSFTRDYAFVTSNSHWFHPALGYLPSAILYRLIAVIAPDSLPINFPPLNPLFATNSQVYPNLFLHSREFGGDWERSGGVLALRLMLSLLGLPVILVAYRIGQTLDQEQGILGLVAAGCIAFLPQFTFINASVRNDTLANVAGALVFLLSILMLTTPLHRSRYAIMMGVTFGAGLLCKFTFLYTLPVGLLAVLLTDLHSPRQWVRPFVYILVPAFAIWGVYHLAFEEARIALAYTFSTGLAIKPQALTLSYLAQIPQPLFIELFFARFGWANVGPSIDYSRLAFGIWLIGACITAIEIIRSLKKPGFSLSLKILVLLIAGIFLAVIGVFRFNLTDFQPQGRYLFAALVPWALLGYWGTGQVLPTWSNRIVGGLVVGSMLVFNIYSLSTIFTAYY